jgi:hypothetical protein
MILICSVKKIVLKNMLGMEFTRTVVLSRDTKTGKLTQRSYDGDHTENIKVEWTPYDADRLVKESRKGG